MKHLLKASLVALSLMGTASFAVNPDEVLDDPAIEARARDISAQLRCVVCRGENIDESNANIARDLRLLVRERLQAGDENEEVVDFIVERYGEYVLMKPNTTGANIVLWAAGPMLFLLSMVAGGLYLRRRAQAKDAGNTLSQEEESRLQELLKD
jgi:cytochrome c-type biogenesis protein CcmH